MNEIAALDTKSAEVLGEYQGAVMTAQWQVKRLEEVCHFSNGLWKGEKPPFVNVGVIRIISRALLLALPWRYWRAAALLWQEICNIYI